MNLEQCKKAILFKNKNISNVPMPDVIKQLNSYMDKNKNSLESVEASALQFYLLNQAFGLLSMSVDPKTEFNANQEKLAKLYLINASESSARLFYYMLLIVTREARHLHASETFYKKLTAKYGEAVVQFQKSLKGAGSDLSVKKLREASSSLADVSFGKYISCFTEVFSGSFSGGYGGKPWGNIADTLRKMVFGETSIEIMNDTAWTLAHNNGPMFNKGMLYKGYSPAIYKILDVQRAGMIPQLIGTGDLGTLITSEVTNSFEAVKEVFPEHCSGYVDWFKVESLGSLHKYPDEKLKQTSKYGKNKVVVDLEQKEANKFWVNEVEYAVVQNYKRAA